MLPNIHKISNWGRPVVSVVSCQTSQIATYLDHLLTPIVQQLPTYVKEPSAALRISKNFRFNRAHRHLFTIDVKSLYTVIARKDGLITLKHCRDRREIQVPPTATLIRLAELVLTTNTFLSTMNPVYKPLMSRWGANWPSLCLSLRWTSITYFTKLWWSPSLPFDAINWRRC